MTPPAKAAPASPPVARPTPLIVDHVTPEQIQSARSVVVELDKAKLTPELEAALVQANGRGAVRVKTTLLPGDNPANATRLAEADRWVAKKFRVTVFVPELNAGTLALAKAHPHLTFRLQNAPLLAPPVSSVHDKIMIVDRVAVGPLLGVRNWAGNDWMRLADDFDPQAIAGARRIVTQYFGPQNPVDLITDASTSVKLDPASPVSDAVFNALVAAHGRALAVDLRIDARTDSELLASSYIADARRFAAAGIPVRVAVTEPLSPALEALRSEFPVLVFLDTSDPHRTRGIRTFAVDGKTYTKITLDLLSDN